MGQRRQRRQRIVQFMADDADDFFPGLHFLAAHIQGQLAQQQQLVLAAVQAEAAARQVIHLFLFPVAAAEQAVVAARQRLAQRRRGLLHDVGQVQSFQAAPLVQQLPRRQVGIHDGLAFGHQQHGHGRVLHHGVEQQFALHQVQPLFSQHVAERIVSRHQVGQFIVLRPAQAERKVAVLVAGDGAAQGAEQRQHGLQLGADGDDGDRQMHSRDRPSTSHG